MPWPLHVKAARNGSLQRTIYGAQVAASNESIPATTRLFCPSVLTVARLLIGLAFAGLVLAAAWSSESNAVVAAGWSVVALLEIGLTIRVFVSGGIVVTPAQTYVSNLLRTYVISNSRIAEAAGFRRHRRWSEGVVLRSDDGRDVRCPYVDVNADSAAPLHIGHHEVRIRKSIEFEMAQRTTRPSSADAPPAFQRLGLIDGWRRVRRVARAPGND